jgi:hypothetical protein
MRTLASRSRRAAAAEIIDRLECLGGQTTKRKLEHSRSAHERAYWLDDWDLPLERNCIQLAPWQMPQQIVTLTDLPAWAEPKPIVKKRRRNRPQRLVPVPSTGLSRSGRYEEKAAEANAALEQDWRGSFEE